MDGWQNLRDLATNATPDMWLVDTKIDAGHQEHEVFAEQSDVGVAKTLSEYHLLDGSQALRDANYIAAACPMRILMLLGELDAMAVKLKALESGINGVADELEQRSPMGAAFAARLREL